MKKLTFLISILFLSTSLYAIKLEHEEGGQGHKLIIDYKKTPKKKPLNIPIGQALFKIKLSKSQNEQIRVIMKEHYQNRAKIDKENAQIDSLKESFTETAYDKEKYTNSIVKQYRKKVDNDATTMQKIYEILTEKQKLTLKKLIGYTK